MGFFKHLTAMDGVGLANAIMSFSEARGRPGGGNPLAGWRPHEPLPVLQPSPCSRSIYRDAGAARRPECWTLRLSPPPAAAGEAAAPRRLPRLAWLAV